MLGDSLRAHNAYGNDVRCTVKRIFNLFLSLIVTLTLFACPIFADEQYYYGDLFDDADYGMEYYEDDTEDSGILSRIGISLAVGFGISLVIVLVMRSKMTTVRAARNAANYVVSGSLRLRSQSDNYLYSNTVRTPRNTGNSNSRH